MNTNIMKINRTTYAMEREIGTEHVWYCVMDTKIRYFCVSEFCFTELDWIYNDPGSNREELTITEETLADGGFVITVERSDMFVEDFGTVDKYYLDTEGVLVNKEHIDIEPDWDDCPEAWQDDSDRGCSDCPDDECTGHCMSCYYRPC